MKKAIRPIILLLLAGGGYVGYRIYQQHLAEMPLEWSGTVEARTIQVGSKIGGRVSSVVTQEGESVDAGQPLVTLEAGDLPAQRLQAEGQLTQAHAALDRVASHSLSSARRAEIEAARARLESAQVELDKARTDRERMQKLFSASAATKQEFDNADIAFRNNTAQVGVQQAGLAQLMQGTSQDVKSAEGEVQVATARIQQLDIAISELTIRAPVAAHVETLDLRPGDILGPNTAAAELLEPNQLYVRIFVPETQLGYVHLGQQVPVHVDSFPDRSFNGVVEYIAQNGEFSPRNLQTADERADQVFATRVRLNDGVDVLRAGMAAFIKVKR